MTIEDTPAEPRLPPGYAMPSGAQERGEVLRAKLLGETARAPWNELQRFFAQGLVIQAKAGVDMIEVAMTLAEDDKERFEQFLSADEAGPVSDEQALQWIDADATVWTVVVKPWILCLLYTSPSPRDATLSRIPSSA